MAPNSSSVDLLFPSAAVFLASFLFHMLTKQQQPEGKVDLPNLLLESMVHKGLTQPWNLRRVKMAVHGFILDGVEKPTLMPPWSQLSL